MGLRRTGQEESVGGRTDAECRLVVSVGNGGHDTGFLEVDLLDLR
jgi:hypothetical protein